MATDQNDIAAVAGEKHGPIAGAIVIYLSAVLLTAVAIGLRAAANIVVFH